MDIPAWVDVWGPEALGGVLGALVGVTAALIVSTRAEERIAKRLIDYEHEREFERERLGRVSERQDRARRALLPKVRGGDYTRHIAEDPDFVYLPADVRSSVLAYLDATTRLDTRQDTYRRVLWDLGLGSPRASAAELLLEAEPSGWDGGAGGPDPVQSMREFRERTGRFTTAPFDEPESYAGLATQLDELGSQFTAARAAFRVFEKALEEARRLKSESADLARIALKEHPEEEAGV